ncbi:MAG: hypothetical protein F4X19_08480 [Acidobacteria bacterium]|nr:hypothetical protein [Acidobacteriota bacterium]
MDLLTFVLIPNAIEAQADVATHREQLWRALRVVLVGPIPRVLSLIAMVVGILMLYLGSYRQRRAKPGSGCAITDSTRSTRATRSLPRLDGD